MLKYWESLRSIAENFFAYISDSYDYAELGILIGGLVAGYIIGKPVTQFIKRHDNKYLNRFLDIVGKEQRGFFSVVSILILLWVFQILYQKYIGSAYVLTTVCYLLTAWIAIKIISNWLGKSPLNTFVANSIWFIAVLSMFGVLGAVRDSLKSVELFSLANKEVTLYMLVTGVILSALLFKLASAASQFIQTAISRNEELNNTQKVLITKSSKIFMFVIVILVGSRAIGIELTEFTIFTGAIGLGIGFGLQKIFANLVSGLIILMDKSVNPGDIIGVGDTYGIVQNLDARFVAVVTRDGKKHLIPNEIMVTEKVENWTYQGREVRLHIPVSVSYNSDLELVRDILLESAIEASDRILLEPKPKAYIRRFADSGIDFELRVWIGDPNHGRRRTISDIYFTIWKKFKEHNIEIPYPQRDLHIVSDIRSHRL